MYKIKDICICFLCKEDLNKSKVYTNLAKKNIEFWNSKYPMFPLFVSTNNPDEFNKLDCTIIEDQTYFSQFNKFDLIDILEKQFDTVIYLDCDNLLDNLNLNTENIEPGIHVSGNWQYDWGTLKKLEYFKVWKEHVTVEDCVHFPIESVIIFKKHKNWKKTYDMICHFREISNISEKLSNTPDENPQHGPERCEAVALYESCIRHEMPIYLNSKHASQFYDAITYYNNY